VGGGGWGVGGGRGEGAVGKRDVRELQDLLFDLVEIREGRLRACTSTLPEIQRGLITLIWWNGKNCSYHVTWKGTRKGELIKKGEGSQGSHKK